METQKWMLENMYLWLEKNPLKLISMFQGI